MKQLTNFAFFTCFLLGFSLQLTAQAPNWAWANTSYSNGISSEHATSCVSDKHGNVFMTGYYSGTPTFGASTLPLSALYAHHNFLVKYDLNGNVIWAKQTASGGSVSRICIDDFGHLYVVGTSHDSTITFDAITLTNHSPVLPPWGTSPYQFEDIFVAKYDLDGNVIWAKDFGGDYHETVYDISADALGNIILVGSYASWNLTFGAYTLQNHSVVNAMNDIFIAKLDSNGNALWVKGASGNDANDMAFDVQADDSGNIFVSGSFGNAQIYFDTIMLQNAGTFGTFLLKYDANGNALWGKSLNGFSNINDLTIDNTDNLIVTGSFGDSTISFNTITLHNSHYLSNTYNSEVFTLKYDTDGNPIWAKSAGSHGIDEGLAVQSDTLGNIYVAGYGDGGNIDFGTFSQSIGNDGHIGMFIVKYDLNGNEIWAEGNGDSLLIDMIIDPFSNIYVLGSFKDTAVFGSITLVNNGSNNVLAVFLAKMGNIVGLPEMTIKNEVFDLFPNPFTIEMTLIFDTYQENSTLIITDVLGKTIKNMPFSGKELHISKGEMATGVYFVQVQNASQAILGTKKIICSD